MSKSREINKVALVYFSPTHTTQTVIREIARELSHDTEIMYEEFDFSLPNNREEFLHLNKNQYDIIIVGAPVYEGRVPKIVRQYLNQSTFENLPAIATVTYGNRIIGESLRQLSRILEDSGAIVYGLGAFIGQHSFNTRDYPIALGRPDDRDITEIKNFANKIKKQGLDIRKLNVEKIFSNFSFPLKIIPEGWLGSVGYPSKINMEKCTQCKKCARSCPGGAIDEVNLARNKKLCIHCMACVQSCSYGAIYKKFKFHSIVNQVLKTAHTERKVPLYYINTVDWEDQQPLNLYKI